MTNHPPNVPPRHGVVTRWRETTEVPVLRDRDVHVWRTESRDALGPLLSAYLGFAGGPELVIGPFGKPALRDTDSGLAFNLSHSAERVLIAITRAGHVGVDVEYMKPRLTSSELRRIATRFFSVAEQHAISLADDRMVPERFHRIWARKEAFIKGTGLGVTNGLDHFDVVTSEGDPLANAASARDPDAARWHLRDLDAGTGYAAALATDFVIGDLQLLVATPKTFERDTPGTETARRHP